MLPKIIVWLPVLAMMVPSALAAPKVRVKPLELFYGPSINNTIYVEIDWMVDGVHTHKPSQAVLDEIKKTFAVEGYDIQLELSNDVPYSTPDIISGVESSISSIVNTHF